MTMQSVGPVYIPMPIRGDAATPAITTDSMTTTTGKQACVFRIPKSGNLHKIAFFINAITTSSSLTMSLQTVDATTGAPTGTNYNSSASTTFTPATGWQAVTLTADIAVTVGDEVAIVVAATGATVSLTIGMLTNTVFPGSYPYCAKFAGSWTKRSHRPIMGLEYDDGTYGQIRDVYGISSITTRTFNSGSTPDETALKFALTVPTRITGVWVFGDGDGDFSVNLYTGTTLLATVATDKDVRGGTNEGTYFLRFVTPYSAAIGTYRLSVLPTSVTSATVYEFAFPSTAVMDACEGGSAFSLSTRTDAGAWSDTTTSRLMAGIECDQFDDGLSGAGETSLAFAG